MKDKSPDRLGTKSTAKLLLEFSIPGIATMVFNSLYNVVDAAILGYAVGSDGIAVTTLALPVMMLLMGVSMIAGVGGNAMAAIELGRKKKDKVELILANTTILLILLSLIIALIAVFFIDPVLRLIGTTDTLWDMTKIFVQIICIGAVFQSLGGGINNFLRTAGKPMMAFATGALGTVMCVVFNVILVIFLGYGVAGSAIATILGQMVGGIPVLWYFIFNKKAVFKYHRVNFRPEFKLWLSILNLGLASFIMQVASCVVGVVFNHVVGVWGLLDPVGVDGGLAAIGVAQRANFFLITPFIGLTMGLQPVVGYNFGARNWDRVIRALWQATGTAFVLGCAFWMLLHAIPEQIVHLFGIRGDLEDFAADSLKIYSLFIPFIGAQIVSSSYFQSSGQPLKASFLEMIRQICLLIPLYLVAPGFLANLFGGTPLMGVVYCSPVSDIIAFLVTAIFIAFEMRKLIRFKGERVHELEEEQRVKEMYGASEGDESVEIIVHTYGDKEEGL